MKRIFLSAALLLPLVLIFDVFWIGFAAASFYKAELGAALTAQPVWWAAGLFYILYSLGLAYFVVAPALLEGKAGRALWSGVFFGLIAFATYDLTNQATIVGWKITLTAVDMAWGAAEGGAVSLIAYHLAKKILRRPSENLQ